MPYHPDTLRRWRSEGLPAGLETQEELHTLFGLTPLTFFEVAPDVDRAGARERVRTAADLNRTCSDLYAPEKLDRRLDEYRRALERSASLDGILWVPIHGFFWHPRELLGITEHLVSFYDRPALMHEINRRLLEFNIRAVRTLYGMGVPAVVCVSEDLAYKNGPMISPEMFDEFVAPYHRLLVPELSQARCVIALDSDGNVTDLVGRFSGVGYHCINPMERQTGMDLHCLRSEHPQTAFMGGFDKRVIACGHQAIADEFASLASLFRRGRFLPAVDHQTPPEVSLASYRSYLSESERFFREMGVLPT